MRITMTVRSAEASYVYGISATASQNNHVLEEACLNR